LAKEHTDELIAQELADYIENSAQALAAAIREGRASPNSPSLASADELDYYRFRFTSPTGGLMAPEQALTTPDGQRIGPLGIANVYKQLAKAMPPPTPLPEGVT
jgi:hypothetical protein